ncbi:UDP-4-amino-4,6-dideoxy-N-acetyl-beta-L-altrosamine transaminase [Rhodoferax sp. 4810]|uniref:UDP-4-amino-4, 6-dideoxy-N-acetyl-beta-L-altrosamine transaminase n=2 Tax=Thiospirillum jenense TaxID=1653858 RepID=A0A839HFU1_9GAMM|nr:UDP-4-amino-4,6-dideoxy-N-acetyl-beta-L-altrosamine transaminase [Thiospirillum jenense]MBB1073509.1 UDP-4-amino-4,6-dideoxy-N-acetyl-beta-L-altrosamine transaminase [Rhodoferax jenense]MBB1125997.1 UDP-4-amino-4,6-dideoxy-N-acetyl-beta-L-altrosamine transaminase [Thiospirillum jenense]
MIPYSRQSINADDIAAVVAALNSDFITQGALVPAFERAIADYCKVADAVAVANGTAALHLACLALKITTGDIVWTSPISFVASANCARYCGAAVDFVDIDEETQNMSLLELQKKLNSAKKQNTLPVAIIPVHFAGRSCAMQEIKNLIQPYGIKLIEDAAHALGGQYQGLPIGCCQHSDCCIFSLHPLKSITTGEGGLILTNDLELSKTLRLLRNHGITRNNSEFEYDSAGGWYYEQQQLGFNYRITEIQAALGLSQLTRLNEFIAKRRNLAMRYDALLAHLPIKKPLPSENSAWHLYIIELKNAAKRQQVYSALRQAKIGVNVHYIPVHLQPDYQRLGFKLGDFPQAESYYGNALSLPLFPDLTESEQFYVVSELQRAAVL